MATEDHAAAIYTAAVGTVLVAGTAAALVLSRRATSDAGRRTAANVAARVRAWWAMAAVFGGTVWLGDGATCWLFGLMSFLALREMLTLAPTRRADHRSLFWAFFVLVPVQYAIVWAGWSELQATFLPVYAFGFLALRSAVAGDTTRYLERTAKVQWGVLLCVYLLSFAPALLTLDGRVERPWRLLVFLVVVVQFGDVAQYVWGKLLGRHKLAEAVSPNKTWEGFVGGVLTAGGVGAALHRATPFTAAGAGGLGLLVATLGVAGGLVTSAVKRDAGVKDYGSLLPGHGGMMDRIDSLTFAAPVFYLLVRDGLVGNP